MGSAVSVSVPLLLRTALFLLAFGPCAPRAAIALSYQAVSFDVNYTTLLRSFRGNLSDLRLKDNDCTRVSVGLDNGFPFFNRSFSFVYVCPNGFLRFDRPQGTAPTCPISMLTSSIFIYGADLNPTLGNGKVLAGVSTQCHLPNKPWDQPCFIVLFQNVTLNVNNVRQPPRIAGAALFGSGEIMLFYSEIRQSSDQNRQPLIIGISGVDAYFGPSSIVDVCNDAGMINSDMVIVYNDTNKPIEKAPSCDHDYECGLCGVCENSSGKCISDKREACEGIKGVSCWSPSMQSCTCSGQNWSHCCLGTWARNCTYNAVQCSHDESNCPISSSEFIPPFPDEDHSSSAEHVHISSSASFSEGCGANCLVCNDDGSCSICRLGYNKSTGCTTCQSCFYGSSCSSCELTGSLYSAYPYCGTCADSSLTYPGCNDSSKDSSSETSTDDPSGSVHNEISCDSIGCITCIGNNVCRSCSPGFDSEYAQYGCFNCTQSFTPTGSCSRCIYVGEQFAPFPRCNECSVGHVDFPFCLSANSTSEVKSERKGPKTFQVGVLASVVVVSTVVGATLAGTAAGAILVFRSRHKRLDHAVEMVVARQTADAELEEGRVREELSVPTVPRPPPLFPPRQ